MPGASRQTIPQGTINRLYATVQPTGGGTGTGANVDNLKVLSGHLGTEAIRLAFDDTAADLLPTMTGMVTSPRPYQGVTLTMALVKTTQCAAAYMNQFIDNTLIGDVTVWADTPMLGTFYLYNMVLETVREMLFNGTEPVVIVTMRGYRYVNDNAFSDYNLIIPAQGAVPAPTG